MTVTVVRRWFEKLPDYEKDIPLLILDGKAYTPRATLAEVERGTELGKRLQDLVEKKTFGTLASDEETLAKLRSKAIIGTMPDKPLFATLLIPPRTFTPQELANEVQRETVLGRQWIDAEKKQMAYLMTLR